MSFISELVIAIPYFVHKQRINLQRKETQMLRKWNCAQ